MIKSPDVHHSRSYIECYNFYQYYEDYFAIARTAILNRILFVTFFFKPNQLLLVIT